MHAALQHTTHLTHQDDSMQQYNKKSNDGIADEEVQAPHSPHGPERAGPRESLHHIKTKVSHNLSCKKHAIIKMRVSTPPQGVFRTTFVRFSPSLQSRAQL